MILKEEKSTNCGQCHCNNWRTFQSEVVVWKEKEKGKETIKMSDLDSGDDQPSGTRRSGKSV